MHELGPEPNFNESMYFNAFDPATRLGSFFRLGNRANEGSGEMTICLYLPDGRVGFMFARPHVTTNDAFDATASRRAAATWPLKKRYSSATLPACQFHISPGLAAARTAPVSRARTGPLSSTSARV